MARGKQKCKILKEIRRQIAVANDISLVIEECPHTGDCLGTCPRCESEIMYLEHQLSQRRIAGKAVLLAGISASALAMMLPSKTTAQTMADNPSAMVEADSNTMIIEGSVCDKESGEELIGCSVTAGKHVGVATDAAGKFRLKVDKSTDSITVSYVGYFSQTVPVIPGVPVSVRLESDYESLETGIVAVAYSARNIRFGNPIDYDCIELAVFTDGGEVVAPKSVRIERVCEDGSLKRIAYTVNDSFVRIYKWDIPEARHPVKLRVSSSQADGATVIEVQKPVGRQTQVAILQGKINHE